MYYIVTYYIRQLMYVSKCASFDVYHNDIRQMYYIVTYHIRQLMYVSKCVANDSTLHILHITYFSHYAFWYIHHDTWFFSISMSRKNCFKKLLFTSDVNQNKIDILLFIFRVNQNTQQSFDNYWMCMKILHVFFELTYSRYGKQGGAQNVEMISEYVIFWIFRNHLNILCATLFAISAVCQFKKIGWRTECWDYFWIFVNVPGFCPWGCTSMGWLRLVGSLKL